MSPETASQEPLLLAAWSVTTTLSDWVNFPVELRLRTVHYAGLLATRKQTYRSRWEAAATRSITLAAYNDGVSAGSLTTHKGEQSSGKSSFNPFKGW
jgi:hypothetical protein